jgi:putative membrane protein
VDLLREPSILAGVLVAAAWYWRGSRRRSHLHAVGHIRRRDLPWRELSFAGGLLTVLIALDSPVERLADDLFWAHMLQHVLLMMVAAPLIVLGAPWMPFWRPLPLAFRRRIARAVVLSPVFGWLRGTARFVTAPVAAWVLFNADLGIWHVPAAYNLTLRNGAVHYAEHISFLLLGLLFWAQVIDSPPFHARLAPFARVIYATAGSAASWMLAVVLALATSPLYPAQHVGHHSLSALGDQQLAAGVMLGPGSLPYAIVVFYWLYVWLGGEEQRRPRRRLRHSTAGGGVR